MRNILLPLMLLVFSTHAHAINKCEFNGKVTYSEQPCLEGKSTEIAEPPPPTDPVGAKKIAATEKKEANRLHNERLKSEAKVDKEREKIQRSALAKKKKCASLEQRRKWAEEDVSKAEWQAKEKKKLIARRAGEKYALECST